MDAELVLLLRATLALTVAAALVLALRRPARALWGAQGAYLLWTCVPVAVLAASLPKGTTLPLPVAAAWLEPVQAGVAAAAAATSPAWRAWLLPLWLAGVLASAALMAWQQWRFRRALGPLQARPDGLFQARGTHPALPAVVGLLRPRIVLPADFERRYSAAERELVLQHERLHVRRGDLPANALAALLRCLFWFHPLLPAALRRFRHDQELACDAAVIARHPRQRRVYGEAMLKAQLPHAPLPLGCHWPPLHALRERIELLRRPAASPRQRLAAALAACVLACGIGGLAWAARPAAAAAQEGDWLPVPAAFMPPPRYPKEAAEAGIAGEVSLLLDLAADGSVAAVEVERAAPAGVFEAAAVEAARQWKFRPDADDGVARVRRVRVPISFAPDKRATDQGGQE